MKVPILSFLCFIYLGWFCINSAFQLIEKNGNEDLKQANDQREEEEAKIKAQQDEEAKNNQERKKGWSFKISFGKKKETGDENNDSKDKKNGTDSEKSKNSQDDIGKDQGN